MRIETLSVDQMERLYGRRMCSTMEVMEHEIKDMGTPKMMIWSKMDIGEHLGGHLSQ